MIGVLDTIAGVSDDIETDHCTREGFNFIINEFRKDLSKIPVN